MRIRSIAIAAALLLSSRRRWRRGRSGTAPRFPRTPPPETQDAALVAWFRGLRLPRHVSTSGDVARFERYRDSRDGA